MFYRKIDFLVELHHHQLVSAGSEAEPLKIEPVLYLGGGLHQGWATLYECA